MDGAEEITQRSVVAASDRMSKQDELVRLARSLAPETALIGSPWWTRAVEQAVKEVGPEPGPKASDERRRKWRADVRTMAQRMLRCR